MNLPNRRAPDPFNRETMESIGMCAGATPTEWHEVSASTGGVHPTRERTVTLRQEAEDNGCPASPVAAPATIPKRVPAAQCAAAPPGRMSLASFVMRHSFVVYYDLSNKRFESGLLETCTSTVSRWVLLLT